MELKEKTKLELLLFDREITIAVLTGIQDI